jgi:hypothetical protein
MGLRVQEKILRIQTSLSKAFVILWLALFLSGCNPFSDKLTGSQLPTDHRPGISSGTDDNNISGISVLNISSTSSNGIYKIGSVIDIVATFSKAVVVVGTPTITLETGATDRIVDYASGSGTTSLTFTYTVQAGDTSADLNYLATNSLSLNSGSIKDASGNDVTLTLPALGGASSIAGQKTIVIDTTNPTVTSVSSIYNGPYKSGDVIDIEVNFSEAVTVDTLSGTPSITLETGPTDRAVNFSSGSGTSTLIFSYTVQAGDTSADLDYVATSSLVVNSGTIRDAADNDAIVSLPVVGGINSLAGQNAIVIDTTVPTITSVSSTASDTYYRAGDIIPISLTFSEAVTVVTTGGTPTITLETGASDQSVSYSSGSGSTTIIFNYTVQAGDTSSDLNYVATNSLALNSGTIKDSAGNNATLTLPALASANSIAGQKALVVDTTSPNVTNVTSTKPNGTYTVGDTIDITIDFSEAVTVVTNGSGPTITLETGSTDRAAVYSSGSSTSTLTFTYTVEAGDTSSDLNYVTTSSLVLNSGTIKDVVGNNAILTLPALGGGNSISGNKNLIIATVNAPPTLTRNNTLTLKAATTGTITTASYLAVSDSDNSAAQIIFTIGTAPTHGLLKKSGTTLNSGGSFTQADLDSNHITYEHTTSSDAVLDSFTFTVSDGAGGSIALTTFNITPVVAPQVLTRVSPATTPGTSTSVTIKAEGGSVISGRTVKFYTDISCSGPQLGSDAIANGSNEASATATLSTDTAYAFYATVTLNSVESACSPNGAAAHYVLDTTSPSAPTTLARLSPLGATGNDTTPQFRLSGGDSGSLGVTAKIYTDSSCSILAGTGAINSADITANVLVSDATYTFWAMLSDEAGNTSSCSTASVSYTLDTTGPTVAFTSGPSVTSLNSESTSDFVVTYTGVGGGSVNLTNTGVTVNTATGNATCSGISVSNGTTTTPTVSISNCTGNGTVTLTINSMTALDSTGNGSSASALSAAITVDNTAPTVTGLTDDASPATSKSWTWGCSKASCTYRYVINTSSSWSATGSYTSTTTDSRTNAVGMYYIHVQAKDSLGNISEVKTVSAILTFSMVVAPRYSNATNWMDYVVATNNIAASDSAAACDGTQTARSSCIPGAEYKKVVISSLSSCTSLAMVDDLLLFDWTCTTDGSTVTFYGLLKSTKSLKDTINFNNDVDNGGSDKPRFIPNAVTLTGCGSECPISSSSTAWWSNPIAVLPSNNPSDATVANRNPIKLDGTNDGGNDAVYASGTILTLHNSRNTAGFVLNMDKIGVVLNTGTTLTHTGAVVTDATVCNVRSTICLSGSSKFNYFEGTLNGSTGTGLFGVYINSSNNKFSRFGPLSISNYATAGLYLNAPLYTSFKTISVTGTTAGSGIVSASNNATDIYYGDVVASTNGSTTSHYGINLTGGQQTFKSIIANSNAGHGINTITGTSATFTVNETITTNSNGTAGLARGVSLATPTINLVGTITANYNSDFGVYLAAGVTSGTVGAINSTGSGILYNKSAGVSVLGSGMTFGAINVSYSGDAAADYAVKISGSNTYSSITATNNTGSGIEIIGTNTFNSTLEASNNAGSYGIRMTSGTNTFNSTINTSNNTNYGIEFNSGTATCQGDIIANRNGSYGVSIATTNSIFSDILVSGNSSHNIMVAGSGNVFSDIYSSNSKDNFSGIYLNAASKSRFGYLIITNNSTSRDGVNFNSSSYNRFKGILVSAAGRYGIFTDGSHNIFGPSTFSNNGSYGILSPVAGVSIFLSPLSVNNGNTGIVLNSSGAAASTFVNSVSSHNTNYGVQLNNAAAKGAFLGTLLVNNNSVAKCNITAGATGLSDLSCTTAGTAGSSTYPTTQSSAILRIPTSLASSFVGKVTTTDSTNNAASVNGSLTNTNGTATYSTSLNFLDFDNIFRSWGKDGSAFPNSDNRARCTTGTCRIWDWSLSSADTMLRNRSGNGSTINGDDNLDGDCDSGELCDVQEASGNGNGTCEAGEVCFNTLKENITCPVEVRGSEYVYSAVYAYDVNYSAGLNGREMLDVSNGTCELGETCHESGNACTTTGMTCMQKFLKNAMEIEDTGGDSDYLCEAGETCLYTPNYGIYQGHGPLISCNPVVNGGLSGITMFGYTYNGL